MRSIKRLAALLLTMAMLTLTGCAAARTSGPYSVYLISKSSTTEFWKSVFAGANAAKSEYNVDLTILAPETEEEYEVQNDYIRQAIESRADAIVFSAISYTGNAEAINEAVAAGIHVVVIDCDVDSDGVSVRIGTDNVAAGRMTGEAAMNAEEGDVVLGIVNCFVETQNCQERERGLREALRGNTRVKGIYVVNVSTDAEEAKLAAERLVQEHPEINVLVGFNEPLAVGVAEAVDELGLTGQVRAISFDTNMRCIELMQTGAVGALIVQNPYAMGYLGVEKAWQALQGMKFDKHELIDTMTQIVTKENMFTLESQKALFSFS